MVLCIHGFPTNSSALQFEWHWQHPIRSLAVRQAAVHFKSFSGIENNIKLAYTMLNLPEWQSLKLTVNFFSTKYIEYTSRCPSLPECMKVQVRLMDDLPCYTKGVDWLCDTSEDEWNDEDTGNEEDITKKGSGNRDSRTLSDYGDSIEMLGHELNKGNTVWALHDLHTLKEHNCEPSQFMEPSQAEFLPMTEMFSRLPPPLCGSGPLRVSRKERRKEAHAKPAIRTVDTKDSTKDYIYEWNEESHFHFGLLNKKISTTRKRDCEGYSDNPSQFMVSPIQPPSPSVDTNNSAKECILQMLEESSFNFCLPNKKRSSITKRGYEGYSGNLSDFMEYPIKPSIRSVDANNRAKEYIYELDEESSFDFDQPNKKRSSMRKGDHKEYNGNPSQLNEFPIKPPSRSVDSKESAKEHVFEFNGESSFNLGHSNKERSPVRTGDYKGACALLAVEVIDVFSPSPDCRTSVHSKNKRASRICDDLIDLTRSPVFIQL